MPLGDFTDALVHWTHTGKVTSVASVLSTIGQHVNTIDSPCGSGWGSLLR